MPKEKQPDYKKSQNDPYDLNNVLRPRPDAPKPAYNPSPYDLVAGATVGKGKDED